MRSDAQLASPSDPTSYAIEARNMAKRGMVDMNQREDGGVGRILQEQYNETDIQNLRDLQVAHARNVPENGSVPRFNENVRPFEFWI